jgi:hypothetical protein
MAEPQQVLLVRELICWIGNSWRSSSGVQHGPATIWHEASADSRLSRGVDQDGTVYANGTDPCILDLMISKDGLSFIHPRLQRASPSPLVIFELRIVLPLHCIALCRTVRICNIDLLWPCPGGIPYLADLPFFSAVIKYCNSSSEFCFCPSTNVTGSKRRNIFGLCTSSAPLRHRGFGRTRQIFLFNLQKVVRIVGDSI